MAFVEIIDVPADNTAWPVCPVVTRYRTSETAAVAVVYEHPGIEHGISWLQLRRTNHYTTSIRSTRDQLNW